MPKLSIKKNIRKYIQKNTSLLIIIILFTSQSFGAPPAVICGIVAALTPALTACFGTGYLTNNACNYRHPCAMTKYCYECIPMARQESLPSCLDPKNTPSCFVAKKSSSSLGEETEEVPLQDIVITHEPTSSGSTPQKEN